MLNAVDDHSQESRRRFNEFKARVTWILLAAWTVTAVAGWLVVTFTDGGLYNLQWVIGPPAVITIMGYCVWARWKDIVEQQEAFADLGFRLAEPEENRDIAAEIEAMFNARANVTVLGTRVILPDVQCWMAEVREILDRDTEHPDSRTSTVCLFENTGEQPDFAHPFQLEPHNSVATMLFRSLSGWFNRPETSGFHLWYDAVSDEESGLPEFLTPDMREWLGRHSRWSKMRPWTVFDFGKRTLIFRAGTAYEIEKYGPFVSEMQVFAGLRAEAGMTINGPHVKDSERPLSDADWFPQEGHVPAENLCLLQARSHRLDPTSSLRAEWTSPAFSGRVKPSRQTSSPWRTRTAWAKSATNGYAGRWGPRWKCLEPGTRPGTVPIALSALTAGGAVTAAATITRKGRTICSVTKEATGTWTKRTWGRTTGSRL